MTGRDVQQIFSFSIGVITLIVIYLRLRRGVGSIRRWFPFIFITVVTLAFYVVIFIDQSIADIVNGSDASSTVRLAVQITLLLWAYYMPPRTK